MTISERVTTKQALEVLQRHEQERSSGVPKSYEETILAEFARQQLEQPEPGLLDELRELQVEDYESEKKFHYDEDITIQFYWQGRVDAMQRVCQAIQRHQNAEAASGGMVPVGELDRLGNSWRNIPAPDEAAYDECANEVKELADRYRTEGGNAAPEPPEGSDG